MFLEKRSIQQRDSCKAQLIIEGLQAAAACVVIDLWRAGARLRVLAHSGLPERFILALPILNKIAERWQVEQRWRMGEDVRVRFVSS